MSLNSTDYPSSRRRWQWMARVAVLISTTVVSNGAVFQIAGGSWLPQGPAPIEWAQVENINPNNPACGAIQTVAAHPTIADILYIGSVNGGIWRTTNATALRPNWVPLTDFQASLSIGALEFDPADPSHQTL